MVNIIAIVLIVFSIGQILLGIATLTGKFDPLLPKERKKLPAKVCKKASFLNGISMIITSAILCLLGAGMLTSLNLVAMAAQLRLI